WRTLLLSLMGLVVFLLMFVAAFIFNPFESSLPELRDIVPRDVNFFVRKRALSEDFEPFPEPRFWPALTEADGFDAVENGGIGRSFRQGGGLKAIEAARTTFDQVATDSGGFLDIMRDVIGNELIIAGMNHDYSVSPSQPLPTPHWCVYTRVTWRVKMLHGLAGFGFVRGKLEEQGMSMSTEGDLLVVTPRGQDAIYIKRHKDALMIANNTGLLDKAQLLIDGNRDEEPIGRQPAYDDGVSKRVNTWSEDNDLPDIKAIEFVVEPNKFDIFQRFAASWPNPQKRDSMNERVLASFVNLKGWMQVTGGLLFHDGVLGATGQIGLNSRQHTGFQSSFYTAEQQSREQWLDPFLDMVPESACAAAALRMPAGEFLHAMFDALEKDEKSLINDALRNATFAGEHVQDVRDLVDRLRLAFQPRTGFVFRRNVPDMSVDKDGNIAVPVTAKSPMPQVAWVFWLKPGRSTLVESLVTMLNSYSKSFGFQKVYHLRVPFGNDKLLPEPVTEFTNPQIPGTGEIAMLVFREFFVVSNSGPLVRDIVRTRYGAQTGLRSIRDTTEYAELEPELSNTLSGLVWVHGENMQPVLDDYMSFADSSSATPDPEWMMQVRPSAEDEVRKRHFPIYPTKSSMPSKLKAPGSDFDKRVVAYMREKWTRERTNFTGEDRASMQQLRGLTQMFKAAAIQVELQNNYIRYQARIMTDVR
ncbi:MAG: hypothetical protein ACI91B_004474, partial [Planctomycetota bacterium]